MKHDIPYCKQCQLLCMEYTSLRSEHGTVTYKIEDYGAVFTDFTCNSADEDATQCSNCRGYTDDVVVSDEALKYLIKAYDNNAMDTYGVKVDCSEVTKIDSVKELKKCMIKANL